MTRLQKIPRKAKRPAKRPLRVLFCASEMAPFAKTGGLADVTGSLPLALEELGLEVRVVLPKYKSVNADTAVAGKDVKVAFIPHESYFSRDYLYGGPDGDYPYNLSRFSFFCR